MKRSELKKVGEQIMRYFARNDETWAGPMASHVYDDQLVDLGLIGIGEYEQPVLTPYELLNVLKGVRGRVSRCQPRYKLGRYTVEFLGYKGEKITQKKQGIYSGTIVELGITVEKIEILEKWSHETTLTWRIRWKTKPSADDLMLVRLSIPENLMHFLD